MCLPFRVVLGLTSSSGVEVVNQWEVAGAVGWGLGDVSALLMGCPTESSLMVDGFLWHLRLQQERRWNQCSN